VKKLVATISNGTKATLQRLETGHMSRYHTKKGKATPDLRALGDRSRKIFEQAKRRLKSEVRMVEWITTQLGEGTPGQQEQIIFAVMNRGGTKS
jgi:hypothetical protein